MWAWILQNVGQLGLIAAIDLTLSGDDAVVIAMAARGVPRKWRKWTILLGALASVLLQVLFAAAVSFLYRIPLLHAAAGLLLLWIAWKLVLPAEMETKEAAVGSSIFQAVKIIVLADISLSLDNVLALVAISGGNLVLLGLGLLLSAFVLLTGAVWLTALMSKFWWLAYGGGAVLVWVALGMILEDEIIGDWLPAAVISMEFPIKAVVLVGLAVATWWYLNAHPRQPALETNPSDEREQSGVA